jgi:hypothetical protein
MYVVVCMYAGVCEGVCAGVYVHMLRIVCVCVYVCVCMCMGKLL